MQAQQETQSTDSAAAQERQPAEGQPTGIPVRIIEDQESAQAAERGERERAQREKDDLIAQQRMADATEAMNKATQSMKRAAWWSFSAVALGTGLLVWTLALTRQANIATQQAVAVTDKIGKAQTRAYLGIVSASVRVAQNQIKVIAEMVNHGETPARNVTIQMGWTTEKEDLLIESLHSFEEYRVGYINPASPFIRDVVASVGNGDGFLEESDIASILQGEMSLWIVGRIEYETVYDQPAKLLFRGVLADRGSGDWAISICDEGNSAT